MNSLLQWKDRNSLRCAFLVFDFHLGENCKKVKVSALIQNYPLTNRSFRWQQTHPLKAGPRVLLQLKSYSFCLLDRGALGRIPRLNIVLDLLEACGHLVVFHPIHLHRHWLCKKYLVLNLLLADATRLHQFIATVLRIEKGSDKKQLSINIDQNIISFTSMDPVR